jgi:ABC-type antimicrobial peptide transport system permease subunit
MPNPGSSDPRLGIRDWGVVTFWTTRALASSLFGVSGLDPFTYAVVIVTLTFVALASCLAPARRAAATDPMAVLRT